MGERLSHDDWLQIFDNQPIVNGFEGLISQYLYDTHTSVLKTLHLENLTPIEAGKRIDEITARTIARRYISKIRLREDREAIEDVSGQKTSKRWYFISGALITTILAAIGWSFK